MRVGRHYLERKRQQRNKEHDVHTKSRGDGQCRGFASYSERDLPELSRPNAVQSSAEARTNRRFGRESAVVKLQLRSVSTMPTWRSECARCEFRMKCANPQCSRSSRHQHAGRIFRLRLWPAVTHGAPDYWVRYFWLCVSCSSVFTLVFDQRYGVSLAPLHGADAGETKPSLILDLTGAHSGARATGRTGNEDYPAVGVKLSDQEEVRCGRKRILTKKTRSRR